MPGREFTISVQFPVEPERIYHAWLNSEEHSLMTGGAANTSESNGAEFDAWDGYISGRNVELVPHEKIVQHWRTVEFQDNDPDSILEIDLRSIKGGCEMILIHTNIPDDQPDYEQGWRDNYLDPMREYFQTHR